MIWPNVSSHLGQSWKVMWDLFIYFFSLADFYHSLDLFSMEKTPGLGDEKHRLAELSGKPHAELSVCEVLREGKPWQGPDETNLCLLLRAPRLEGSALQTSCFLCLFSPLRAQRSEPPSHTAVRRSRKFNRQWQTKELLRIGKMSKGTGRWGIYLLVILGRMLLWSLDGKCTDLYEYLHLGSCLTVRVPLVPWCDCGSHKTQGILAGKCPKHKTTFISPLLENMHPLEFEIWEVSSAFTLTGDTQHCLK